MTTLPKRNIKELKARLSKVVVLLFSQLSRLGLKDVTAGWRNGQANVRGCPNR